MGSSQGEHWAEISESTSVWGIHLLGAIHRWFGRWPFRLCVYPVVLFYWISNRRARASSLQYLRRLHAAEPRALPRAPGHWLSYRHLCVFAETLLDKILALSKRYPEQHIQVERDVMLARVAEGKGGVIITAHIGCLELCQALADRVPGFRLTALVHTVHAERFNQVLQRCDPEGKVTLLQVTELGPAQAIMLGERVAAGEFIAIAGDRVPLRGGRNTWARFLGHRAPFPIGPYVLASTLGCPMYTMACLHRGDGYHVRFDPFLDKLKLPRADREQALAGYAQAFADWLQQQVAQAPLDWFNFFPFWDQVSDDRSNH
ncbi:acyltransferase [Pseudoxanthomonas dokdonensis]|uniref:Acyltransferase n=1 Tax=Pseudoxanthomonas dokdonensis TaxID=344882 RepID=A0A0R0CXH0_9GAMM|nr:acyltransferase [Pseudoxanthomonas dokdonensis]